VIIVYACLGVLCLEAIVLRRRLVRLASLQIRRIYLVWLALADQVVIICVLPGHQHLLLAAANLLSYAAAAAFVWSNRHIPGVLLIATGGLLNAAAIVANGGTMPASAKAIAASNWHPEPGHFVNSAVVPHEKLAFLGDIFATPRWLPGHDVFSIGDVVIVLAFAFLIYKSCASSSPTEPAGPADDLRRGSPRLSGVMYEPADALVEPVAEIDDRAHDEHLEVPR
jgi:hypothetical protein